MENHEQSHLKQRHGCVTAWFVLMLIANIYTVFTYFAVRDLFEETYGNKVKLVYILMALSIINLFMIFLLFKWKRAGFYGIVATGLIACFINITLGLPAYTILIGLAGIGILFGILQIQQNGSSAWNQLE